MRLPAVVALLVSVLGRAAGFGAGDGTRQMCDAINLSRSFGVSLDQALSSYVSSANLPAGCNLNGAFNQICSDAGLACQSNYDAPSPINFASASNDTIMSYQRSVANFADCKDNGALRPVSTCISDSDFSQMNQTMNTANTSIKSAITTVQSELADATGTQAADLRAQLEALQSAKESVENAITAIAGSMNYVEPSGGLSPGAIAGIAIGSVAAIALAAILLI